MAFTISDVQTAYKTLIKDNVSDPNPTRNGKEWVYDDVPAITLGAAHYPRISVLCFNAPSEPHELNSHKQRLNARIEIQIRVNKGFKVGTANPNIFANDLAENVIEALRLPASITYLRDNAGIFQPVLEAENTIQNSDIIIKQLIYKNILAR